MEDNEMEGVPGSSGLGFDEHPSMVSVFTPEPPYSGDFGEYLSNQYSVLKLVMSYLNYYDLNALRGVNVSFKTAVDILLKKRVWIQYMSLNYMHGTDHRPEPVHEGHFIDLRIEPQLLFTFECMSGGQLSSRSRPKICMRLRDNNDDRFFPKSDILPNSVKTFVPIGAKSIFYPDKNYKNEMTTVQSTSQKKLALLYLPTSDGYDVSIFTRVVSTDMFPTEPVDEFFSSDPRPIRGIIFLKVGAPHIDGMIRYIVQLVSNNQKEPFALSGGHVANLDFNSPPKKNVPGVVKAVVFRGNGIHCVSDYIGSTEPHLALEGLKSTATYVNKTFGKLNVHKTFIMMFQCVDRNGLPDHDQIASTYPNIPIFGMQTWGEIGFKSFKSPEWSHMPKKTKINYNARG